MFKKDERIVLPAVNTLNATTTRLTIPVKGRHGLTMRFNMRLNHLEPEPYAFGDRLTVMHKLNSKPLVANLNQQ
jgi:hypothetical protein